MSLFVLYLSTRYDVNGFNVLRDITNCLFYVTFTFTYDLKLLSRSLALLSLDVFNVVECLYQKLKFVDSVEFEILTIVWKKLI